MTQPGATSETLGATSESFPLQIDGLTTEWLQEALGEALGGARLKGFTPQVIGVGEGFMGQLARVSLEYDGERGDAPARIIAKFAAPAAETRQMARDQNAYAREIGFYRDIGQAAGIPVAHCYFSALREESYHCCLLLEDLAPGVPSDQVVGTSKATSRRVIEAIAAFHAKWWNSEELESYPWARWVIQEVPMEEGRANWEASVAKAEETGRFDPYPEMKRLLPLLRPLFKLEVSPPFPFSLVHGDLRSDNVIEPSAEGGRFAILDWQISGIGDPIYDVARWLVQSISIEDRRETEPELLKLYHAELVAHGVRGYSYRKFLRDYQTNLVVTYLMFSMSMDAVDDSSERAQALFHQFYSRLDAALVDWKIERLLKALPVIYPFVKMGIALRRLLGRGRA